MTSSRPRRSPEHSAAQRAVARRLHPDVGGDPTEFIEALRRVDEHYAEGGGTSDIEVRRRRRTRLCRVTRKGVARVRRTLPPTWPGARRYGNL